VFSKIEKKIFIKVCVGNLTHVLCLAFYALRNSSVLTSPSVMINVSKSFFYFVCSADVHV
jgi:hypothetical protein